MDKSNISVLVVDDNEMNLDMLSRRLTNEEYVVEIASSGEDAIKLLEVEKFDIILLDIMMPDIDGYDVLRWVKTNPVHVDTPVLMLTASNERESVVKSIELGASDYLTKPFDIAMVKIRMWKCLSNTDVQQRYDGQVNVVDANVLVVDDNEMNRELLCRRIQGIGCKVDAVEDGEKALNKLNAMKYHLVLLDINMPGMDGVEVLKNIKMDPDMAETAVIMVSANDEESMPLECMTIGALDYINKPYNIVVLRARIVPILHTVLLNEIDKERESVLRSLDADGARIRGE